MYYSHIIAYDISVLEFIGVSITSVWYLDLFALHCACAPLLFVAVSEAKMSRQTTLGNFISARSARIEIIISRANRNKI